MPKIAWRLRDSQEESARSVSVSVVTEERFLIVVGQMASQVMATIAAEHPGVGFIYQPEARGTGHAAACAEVLNCQ